MIKKLNSMQFFGAEKIILVIEFKIIANILKNNH